jgi:SnoaL-like domain
VSADRVAIVRRFYELVNDFTANPRLTEDELLEIVDPGFRLDASRYVFNPGVYEGVEGFRQFLEGILEMWETIEIQPQELLQASNSVVALIVLRGRGRAGIEVNRKGANVFTLRDDRVLEWVVGMDEAEALAAMGRAGA